MVSALLEQPLSGEPQRRAPQPAALMLRRKEDVEAGMATVRIRFLAVPEPPGKRAVDFDRKGCAVVPKTLGRVLGVFERSPPIPDAGPRHDSREQINVPLSKGSQGDTPGAQSNRHGASLPLAGRAGNAEVVATRAQDGHCLEPRPGTHSELRRRK